MVFPHRFSLTQKKAQCNLFCTALSKAVIFKGYSPDAIKKKTPEWVSFFIWAMRDSNPHSCGYEPRALTVKLMALTAAAMPAHCHNG